MFNVMPVEENLLRMEDRTVVAEHHEDRDSRETVPSEKRDQQWMLEYHFQWQDS